MNKRLYRSQTDRVLGGVCGGFGEYLGISPIFIRVFLVLWTILGEHSVLIYLLLWLIIPSRSTSEYFRLEDLGARFRQMGQEFGEVVHEPASQLIIYTGVGLICWGVYYLLRRLDIFSFSWEQTWYLWPALLIVAGLAVLVKTLWKKK